MYNANDQQAVDIPRMLNPLEGALSFSFLEEGAVGNWRPTAPPVNHPDPCLRWEEKQKMEKKRPAGKKERQKEKGGNLHIFYN